MPITPTGVMCVEGEAEVIFVANRVYVYMFYYLTNLYYAAGG